MAKYVVKPYERGFENEQLKVSFEVIKDWVWLFQTGIDSLRKIYYSPNFDPETALFCFKDDEMIGFTYAVIGEQDGVVGPSVKKGDQIGATLFLPRVLPNNEEAADLLMEKIIEVLKSKRVPFILTRASTMHTGSIELVNKWGFIPHKEIPFGYKLYYHYVLDKGKLEGNTNDVERFNPNRDIEDCVQSVSKFFKLSKEKAKEYILETDKSDLLVSHLVIRKDDKLEAYCYALPNELNKDIIATFHLEASNEEYLEQLLVQVIDDCLEKEGQYFLVDVIGKLRKFEKVFIDLGFDKVAIWGIYQKDLF